MLGMQRPQLAHASVFACNTKHCQILLAKRTATTPFSGGSNPNFTCSKNLWNFKGSNGATHPFFGLTKMKTL